jgi:hypothetical protein
VFIFFSNKSIYICLEFRHRIFHRILFLFYKKERVLMNIGNGQCECGMVLGRITHAGIGDRIDSPIMHMLIMMRWVPLLGLRKAR